MSYRILVNPGTQQVWEINLKPGVNRIGRGEANDFIINHPSVSTNHCEIMVSDAGVFLKDFGSTNGTFINGTPTGESWLQPGQHIRFGAVDTVLESDVAPTSAPAPAVARSAAPSLVPTPPSPTASGLRISKPQPAHAPGNTIPAAAEPAAQPVPPRFQQPAATGSTGGRQSNFALSLAGVVLGAALGLTLWHLLYRLTGWKIGIMALGIGCLAGVAPQLLGHYRSKLMGVIAAVVALLAILAAQYLNARVQFSKFVDETVTEVYQERLAYARRVTQAVPNGTDPEIRAFLAKEYSDSESTVKPEEIEAEAIEELKRELTELRDMAGGKVTQEQYGQALRKGSEELEATGIFKIYLAIRALGLFNIVNIVLGIGAAYLTAKGDD
jgi:hypothetical protein